MNNKYLIYYVGLLIFICIAKIEFYFQKDIFLTVGTLLEIFLAWFLFIKAKKESGFFPFQKIKTFEIFWWLLGGLILAALGLAVPGFIKSEWLWQVRGHISADLTLYNNLYLQITYAVICMPFLEEFFFRGIFYNCLIRKRMAFSSVIVSIVFSLAHSKYVYGEFLELFLLSLFYNFIFKKKGILASYLIHVAFNSFGKCLFPLLREDLNNYPDDIYLLILPGLVFGVMYLAITFFVYSKKENLIRAPE